MKPVQCGGSELGRNWLGRNADVDPAPTMIVFPSEQSCRENVEERIIPMIQDSPRLRNLLTGRPHDLKKGTIHLRSCSIYMGWAGSPQSLASRPVRYVLLDEVDKYPAWRGVEAGPQALAEARTTTYGHNRTIFKLSTPTIPSGNIAQAIKACPDVRDYCVRCPNCSEFQAPEFERMSWPGKDAQEEEDVKEVIRQLQVEEIDPTYTCISCDYELSSLEFRAATRDGEWISVGCERGEHPVSRSVGFRLSGLCALPGLVGVAVEWMKTRILGLERLQHFYNSVLGLPFWDESNWGDPNLEVHASRIFELSTEGGRKFEVPEWATTVVLGADTSKQGHQYTVYAVGEGYRMQLLDYGEADGEAIIRALDREWSTAAGVKFKIRRVCMDLGGSNSATSTRTEDVYRLAQREPSHIWPVKGHGGNNPPKMPIQTSVHTYAPPGGKRSAFDVKSSVIDTQYFKDLLSQAINQGTWHPFQGIDRDFVKQMASEKKVLVETRVRPDKTQHEVWRWLPKTAGIANHYWDATVYALVAAHMLGAGEAEPEQVVPVQRYDDDQPSWATGRRSSKWI